MKSQRLLRRAHRTRRHRRCWTQNPLSGRPGFVGEIVSLGVAVSRLSRPTSIHQPVLQRIIVHRHPPVNLQLLLLTGRLSYATKLLRHARTTLVQRRYSRHLKSGFGCSSDLPLCARPGSRARRRTCSRAPIVLVIRLVLVFSRSSGTRVLPLSLFPRPTHVLELSWSSLGPMPLHRDVGVEMVERSISFGTSWKVARVEPFDFVEFPPRTLAHGISR